jgi:diguanylate cyclase (GGDEF)-like protein/PAS domain S-box-containing protein
MANGWSLERLQQLVGQDGQVSFTDRGNRVRPPPPGLVLTPRGPDEPSWDGNLLQVHPPDRTSIIRAFKEALDAPGTLHQIHPRVDMGGSWVRCRVQFLNLLAEPAVLAMVRMFDEVEILDPEWAEPPPAADAGTPAEVPSVRIRCDAGSTVMTVDGAAEHIFGVGGRELVGRHALDFIHPDDVSRCLKAGMEAAANIGTDVAVSATIIRTDGKLRPIVATVAVPSAADGDWRLVMRDAQQVLHRELLHAIEADELVVEYQPVVDLPTGRIVGAEALVRWHHPTRGLVPPLDFIPGAEASGAIVEVGSWVLRTACAEAVTWPEALHVAVNLSVRQLVDVGIVALVRDALLDSGLAPSRLVLELTESALMDRPDQVIAHLHGLKALGLRLAIDDFGTGYSSLQYLKQMPVDILKVDRSFVAGLGDSPGDTAIVASVVALAHVFGASAVAEGVETTEQQDHLRLLRCEQAQGYLWSRPIPAGDFRSLLASEGMSAVNPCPAPDAPVPTNDGGHDGNPWILGRLDVTGKILEIEGRVMELTGRQAPALIGLSPVDLMDPGSSGDSIDMWWQLIGSTGNTSTTRRCFVRPDGTEMWAECTYLNRLGNERKGDVLWMATDITERRALEQAQFDRRDDVRRLTEQCVAVAEDLRILADVTPTAVFRCDREGTVTFHNARWDELRPGTRLTRVQDAVHLSARHRVENVLQRLVDGDGPDRITIEVPSAVGTRVFSVTCRADGHGNPSNRRIVGSVEDITATVRLGCDGGQDDLTGLVNRRSFDDHLAAALRTDPAGMLLVLLDLDGFSTVNGLHGRDAGDIVLQELGARLAEAVRPTDTISRYGGDEFAVVCTGVAHDGVEAILDRLRLVLGAVILFDGGTWQPSASIGTARAHPGDRPASLIERADLALFDAKQARDQAWVAAPHLT